jgi:uncharacterized protein
LITAALAKHQVKHRPRQWPSSPLLVVHGSEDRLINPALGQQLFAAAQGPKKFVMVNGGSHHNTNSVGQAQCKLALKELFNL